MAVENVWGLVAVLVFYVVILVIGIVTGRKELSRKSESNTTETMLAGRDIGMFVGVFTMTATWVGGGFINGTAEAVYNATKKNGQGLIWAQAPVGFSISLLIAGLFFAKPMRRAGYTTMIDPFQRKLGDWMGAVLVLPAVSGEIFWSASILAALGSTLSVIIGLDLWISIIVSACVALLYVVIGGLASVVYTDVIQLFCIAAGLITAIPFAIQHEAVGDVFTPPANSTTVEWLGYLQGRSWGAFIDDYLLLMCGGIPWQVYFQRVLASRTPQIAQTLSFIGGIGCLLMAIAPMMIGAIGFSTDWNQTSFKGVLEDGSVPPTLIVPLVLQYLTPPVVAVIGLGAVSAAVMSSADSSMLSSSTMFAQNVYKPVFRPKASAREVIWVMRFAALVFCALATVLAITTKTIYGLFVMCGDIVYVLLFPQLVCTMFVPWFNTFGSLAGFIVSLTIRLLGGEGLLKFQATVAFPWYDVEANKQYFPFKTMCMLIGFAVMLPVSYITDRMMKSGRLDRKWLRRINNQLDRKEEEEEYSKDSSEDDDKLGVTNKGVDVDDGVEQTHL